MQKIKQYCTVNQIPYHEFEYPITPKKFIDDLLKSDEELTCPYLKEGRCSIYPVRPTICRMWGAVESMPCSFGCEIEGRLMKNSEAHGLLDMLK